VTIPTEASQKRNFLLIAVTDTNDTIEGVFPIDPAEIGTTPEPQAFDPNSAGPAAMVRVAAKAGVTAIDMAPARSLYSDEEIKAMSAAQMTTLVTRLREREQAMIELKTEFTEYAAKIQQLMDYSFQLSRNPDYMGYDNHVKFEEAMQAKAVELGLPIDARSAIDTMEVSFIGSDLPPKEGIDFGTLSRQAKKNASWKCLATR